MNDIKWNKKAWAQIKKIQAKDQTAIINAVEALPSKDGQRNVIKLVNHQYGYRLRVGRYRVLFDVDDNEIRVYLIQEVKKRDEHTY